MKKNDINNTTAVAVAAESKNEWQEKEWDSSTG